MTFQVEGIHITKDPYDDCSRTRCRVTLDNLSVQSTGTYRCEVSGDAPTFRLTYETSNMTIIGKLCALLQVFGKPLEVPTSNPITIHLISNN